MITNKKGEDWKDHDPDQVTSERWKKDTNNWKIGNLIYYNKEDKRLFVSKKIEWMGTTLNFANRKSALFMIGTLLFFGFVLFTTLRDK
jgi:uncharacterized membrane protein